MAALYAEDAVHEFPFTTPGGPTRIEGGPRSSSSWPRSTAAFPLRYTGFRTIAVHRVDDAMLVVEQEALGVRNCSTPPARAPHRLGCTGRLRTTNHAGRKGRRADHRTPSWSGPRYAGRTRGC